MVCQHTISRFLFIFTVFLLFVACEEAIDEDEKIHTTNETLSNSDSVVVWTSQWYDYYDTSDCTFEFGETCYGGAIYIYLDTAYFLSSGYGLTRISKLFGKNELRYTQDKGKKVYWCFSRDTLRIENLGLYEILVGETKTYFISKSYLKRVVPANEVLDVLNAGIKEQEFTRRDTFLSIDLSNWVVSMPTIKKHNCTSLD